MTGTGGAPTVPVGAGLLGRVIDALGRPLDDGPPLDGPRPSSRSTAQPPHPLRRARVDEPLSLGVRTWDTLAAMGKGQRVGVFAGSGVGKSTLMGMVARGSTADVNVVALIGERGREVREFIEGELGEDGLARSVVVVATSDTPALVRLRAAAAATRIAESFRDEGHDVVLMMDSLTRYCMAQREIGLSAGEPPTSRGYPPSVFTLLPRLLERAGTGGAWLDHGHLHRARRRRRPQRTDRRRRPVDPRRAHRAVAGSSPTPGTYPAIDPLASVSRVASAVTTPDQQALATEMRRLLAAYADARDLIEIGAYVAGTNPTVDRAIALRSSIDEFLRQRVEERTPASEAFGRLADTARRDGMSTRRLDAVLRVRALREQLARGDIARQQAVLTARQDGEVAGAGGDSSGRSIRRSRRAVVPGPPGHAGRWRPRCEGRRRSDGRGQDGARRRRRRWRATAQRLDGIERLVERLADRGRGGGTAPIANELDDLVLARRPRGGIAERAA